MPADSSVPEEFDDTPEVQGPLEPEEVAAAALETRAPLTPAEVAALNQTRRDAALYDDEGSRSLVRRIDSRMRRATHLELHAGCTRVIIDVPVLPNKQFVRVNEKTFVGTHEVWECEARTILALVHFARVVEAARLSDTGGGYLDLDAPLAERARAIQRA